MHRNGTLWTESKGRNLTSMYYRHFTKTCGKWTSDIPFNVDFKSWQFLLSYWTLSLVNQTLFQAHNTSGIKQKQSRRQKIPAGPKLAFHLPTSWTQCLYSLWVPALRISQLRFIGDNQAKVILAYFPCLELNAVNTAANARAKGKERRKNDGGRKNLNLHDCMRILQEDWVEGGPNHVDRPHN